MSKKIFFSSSNAPGAVYKIKEFQKLGYYVISGDANNDSIGRLLSDKFYCLPWQREENYFDTVFEIIQKENVDVFVPSGEDECLRASRMRQKFTDLGCILVAANTLTIETAIDKTSLYDYLSQHTNIPMLRYHVVNSLVDFDEGLEKMKGFPLCIKPASGSGSRGFIIIDNQPASVQDLFTKKVSFMTYSTDYIREAIRNTPSFPKLILMERLDDINYDTNLVCKDGEVLWQSVKTREEAKIGTITKGEIISHPELEEINRKVARALNTTGLISTQFIGNKLIEINPRWSTSLNFKSINEFLYSIQVWTGEPLHFDLRDVEEYQGLRMIRYWDVVTYKDGKAVE